MPSLKTDTEVEAVHSGAQPTLESVQSDIRNQPSPKSSRTAELRHALLLLLVAIAAVAITGYHPYSEDAGIYVSGIKRVIHPSLYDSSAVFIAPYLKVSLFPEFGAWIIRSLHLPLEAFLFTSQILTTWLLLFACWSLARRCFERSEERWAALLLTAVTLSVPVAGTSLFLMDPYLTSRSFSTPLSLLAAVACLDRKYLRAIFFLLLIGLFHPLMVIYAAVFVLLLWAVQTRHPIGLAALVLGGIAAAVAVQFSQRNFIESVGYQNAIGSRYYFFLANWHGYEQLGVVAPLLILAAYAYWRTPRTPSSGIVLSKSCIAFGLTSVFTALAFARSNSHSHLIAALQPLRPFLLIYFCMFVILGGLLGRFLLKRSIWRWVVVFVGTGAGLALAQHAAYPASPQLELPGAASTNAWTRAFLWIRNNTSADARIALDSDYIHSPGEDGQGFRAIAERDALADRSKDGGAAAVFRQLADRWWIEQSATTDLNKIDDAERLRRLTPFHVDWVVLNVSAPTLFHCPFTNEAVKVCRLP